MLCRDMFGSDRFNANNPLLFPFLPNWVLRFSTGDEQIGLHKDLCELGKIVKMAKARKKICGKNSVTLYL